ncbi:MAG TPA: hypothetical protein VGR47_17140 [Terracidiphilus sp.]|nr:hypothetical protein [Terracidiphilus sp.]
MRLRDWFRRSKHITMDEWMRQLEADPEYVRRRSEREKEIQERKVILRAAEKPLLEDLAKVGLQVDTVWDLVNTSSPYSNALPVLLDHLQRPYPDEVREGIARALAVRSTRPIGWRILVNEFCKTASSNKGVKDGLAAALSGASDNTVLPELVALAKDQRHGDSRLLLLIGIRRSRRPEAKAAVAELARDPVLAKEIASWRRRD